MTLEELCQILNLSGIDFAYHHWKSKKEPPFGIYIVPSTDNFKADGKVCVEIKNAKIELYTKKKDIESETKIKNVLNDAEIYYEQISEVFIESEGLYQIVYEIQI